MASQMVGVAGKRLRQNDAGGRTLSGRLAIEVREERLMAKIIAGIGTSHTPAIGAARRQRPDGRAVLDAGVQGLRAREEVDGRNGAGRRDRRLQRSRQRVRFQNHSHVRTRLRRRIPDRGRGLGRAPGARGQGVSRARGSHGAVARSRRVRHDDRERDAGRPRPHRTDVAAVRPAESVARARDPAGRERDPVSCADGPSLLHARQSHQEGRRELGRGLAAS